MIDGFAVRAVQPEDQAEVTITTQFDSTELQQGQSVLLAEDDEDVRSLLKCLLESTGYHVIEAKDGMELMCFISAVAVDEHVPPDLIISDIRMPIFSGLDMLRAVQRSSVSAPVVLISAYSDEATRSLADQLGAAALLRKPVAMDDLLATLARVLPQPETGTSG